MTEDSTDHLSLYALAAHAAGDWPLQTNDMATEKFDDPQTRAKHVAVYTLAFLPVALASDWNTRGKMTFLVWIAGSHFAIDTRRWAENYESFPTRALWFDQAVHLISIAVGFLLAERATSSDRSENYDSCLEQAAEDADHICRLCGYYVKSMDNADVDEQGRFGHGDCLKILNRSQPMEDPTDA